MSAAVKRNAIVGDREAMIGSYGRVSRVLDAEHVEVIDCGRMFRKVRIADLAIANDYRGYWDDRGPLRERHPVFVRMPSLRKLKQMALRYNPSVFRKNHRRMNRAPYYSNLQPMEP